MSKKKRLLKSSLPKPTYEEGDKKLSFKLPEVIFNKKKPEYLVKHIKSEKLLPPIFQKYP